MLSTQINDDKMETPAQHHDYNQHYHEEVQFPPPPQQNQVLLLIASLKFHFVIVQLYH